VQKRIVLIVISIILATFATLLIKVYLERQAQIVETQAKQDATRRQEKEVTVVVASRDIPKGSTIETGMLAMQTALRDYVQPQAVGAPERVAGMITMVPISKGEQITLNKLMSAKEATATGSSLAMLTPAGKRAITISVDNISSLLGMIKPGDYVDVVASVPVPIQTPDKGVSQQLAVIPLFQNVLILAVGKQLGAVTQTQEPRYQSATGAEAVAPITLALFPQEANLLAFVQEQGKIRLVLRSPADANVEAVPPASWDTVFQYMMKANPQAQAQAKDEEGAGAAAPKERQIEIYRGLKKESITLYR
jgi:pilus assembly protein CpaB